MNYLKIFICKMLKAENRLFFHEKLFFLETQQTYDDLTDHDALL